MNREELEPVMGVVDPVSQVDEAIKERADAPQTHPSFDALVRIMWRLHQPDGCPWDLEQTHESLVPHMVEEAYEAAEALRQNDRDHMIEELGDVLEQVILNAQIGADEQSFSIDDVCAALNEKLVRRHPHVFGELSVAADKPETGEEVLNVWDQVKAVERAKRSEASKTGMHEGLLDSIPISFPALMQAQKVSKRAAKAGFEWDSVADVWDQVASEKLEFEAEEQGSDAAEMEFGDLLFALVNVARMSGIDAESALTKSTMKFRRRWAEMERIAADEGRAIDEYDTQALNELWQRVKDTE